MKDIIDKLIKKKTLVVITGPTASGKTGVSIELSKLIDIEVISADSRQIFKYMDIGTAKPTSSELASVKTHFISLLEPNDYFSAGKFADEAEIKANDIFKKNKIPVVVGGTGLYIKALCQGLFDEDIENSNLITIREKLTQLLSESGISILYNKLKEVDPISAEKYNDMNPRRIIRALEYYEAMGIPLSEAQKKYVRTKEFNSIYFGIELQRELLYDRINQRVEFMWNNGLIEETKALLEMGFSSNINSLNTVGYKEVIAYLRGEISSDDALEKMKQNTRRYAKRQMTWMRKIPGIKWISGTGTDLANKILNEIKNN